jgi:hypothetical protein
MSPSVWSADDSSGRKQALVQTKLEQRPFFGHVFLFGGRQTDRRRKLYLDRGRSNGIGHRRRARGGHLQFYPIGRT